MPIRAELSGDRERGPGHAQLRISGLRAVPPFDFALERSQGTTPYLGAGGVWQATEAWHTTPATTQAGDAVVVALGPDLVDAIVQQGVAVTFRLWVATDTAKECGTLTISRPLLGSRAAAPPPAVTSGAVVTSVESPPTATEPAPALETSAEAVPWPEPEPVPADLPAVTPPPSRRGPWIAAAVVLLALIGVGVAAWSRCLVPGFGPAACRTGATSQQAGGGTAPPAGARSCSGLDGAHCLEVARAALTAGEVEAARQLLQQASELGSIEANNDMAHMYDPKTWRADTSPVAQADWETAVYWYETAARQKDPAGHLGAGRLLCAYATTDFERRRGLEYLRTVANGGNEEAKTLAAECEKKVTP